MIRPTLWLLVACSVLRLSAFDRTAVVPTIEPPVYAVDLGDGHWFLDFGQAAFGNVALTAPATTADASPVIIHLGEARSTPTTVDRAPAGTVRYQRHEVTLRPDSPVSPTLTWAPPTWMKDGWLTPPANTGEIMPFRYVELEHAPASFKPDQIKRIAWTVPFDDHASAFTSSSPALNAVWDLCKHSIKATTFLGLYVDGDRERRPYEADVLINQLGHYCVDAHYETARHTHEFLLENPTWPTEWRLQSVILAWHDFLWSGDDTSLRHHYATLKGRAMIERRTADGLFEGWNDGAPKDIVDWPAVERDGYDMDVTAKTVVTAFHYRALVLLAEIATHLGHDADAAEFTALAAQTRATVNDRLWDDTRGCYVDGLDLATDRVSPHASIHANFFPLALGLVPPERGARVAAFLKPAGMACSVYGAQFLLDALYDAGEGDAALALLTADDARSWLNMVEKVGSTITLEAWDPAFKPNLDWNHAWGAAPANIIPRRLMGIEPLEPGFARFRVKPQTASLVHASITFPTPHGGIQLDLRGTEATTWQADLTVPTGTVAEFHLPFPGTPQLNENGKAIAARVLRVEHGRAVVELPAGHRVLTLTTTSQPTEN